MIITIEIAPGLEQQLRQEAARVGLAPEAYIIKAVQERLTQTSPRRRPAPHLSPEKAQLLSNINFSLSPTEWERYHALVARRKAETLSPDEQRVPLYHPRRDRWFEHFAWHEDDTLVIGLTPTGRAVVNLRRVLSLLDLHPPED
jgi:hypothetical protein